MLRHNQIFPCRTHQDGGLKWHTTKVGYFVGSLAANSINRTLAKAHVKLAPSELVMSEISFKDLPLYSCDYDANYPAVATEFKNTIAAVDAILFVPQSTTAQSRAV